jgi:hypothetical protein
LTKIFKNNNKIVYFTQKSPQVESGHFDVILSPVFYWVKKVELPVKKVSAAKRLAESVFEGSLPEGDFAYEVSKIGEEFVIIAYDKESISKALSEKFVKDAKVSAVYFAQNEFTDLSDCCGIDVSSSLVNLNGLIMEVPRVCTASKSEVGELLKDKKLSNKKITLSDFESSVVEKKELYLLAAGFALLFGSFVLDWVNYSKATSSLDAQRSEIIASNHLPSTSMQLNSIKKSLIKTYKVQKKMRDEVYGFNSLHLQKGEYIDKITTTSKQTEVVIKVDSSSRERAIKAELSKKLKIKDSRLEDDMLTIKVDS